VEGRSRNPPSQSFRLTNPFFKLKCYHSVKV
jgi:hypothetical protein